VLSEISDRRVVAWTHTAYIRKGGQTMSQIPSYEDVLKMLAQKAADGSVSAMVALERALRPSNDTEVDEVGDAIDAILADKHP
jgi:hypothetical protein